MSLSDTVFLDPRQSPSQGPPQHQEPQYSAASMHHGLGISGTTGLDYMQPGLASYEHQHQHQHQHQHPHQQLHRQMLATPIESQEPLISHGHHAPGTERVPAPRSIPARNTPINIAPDPAGLKQLEQERQIGHDIEQSQRHNRQRRRTRRRSYQLDEETGLAIKLRTRHVPWKEVIEQVNATYGGNQNASRLQMRIARFRQRLREWSEDDVSTCACS